MIKQKKPVSEKQIKQHKAYSSCPQIVESEYLKLKKNARDKHKKLKRSYIDEHEVLLK